MRTTEELDSLIERNDRRTKALREREKKLARAKTATSRLARFDVDLAIVREQEERISLEREFALARVEEIKAKLAFAIERDGFAIDGTAPTGSEQAALEGKLAAAEVSTHSGAWAARQQALTSSRRRIEQECAAYAEGKRSELEADLLKQGIRLVEEINPHLAAVQEFRDPWAALAGAYRQLEAALGGPRRVGRLDIPEFPVSIASVEPPVPAALNEDKQAAEPSIPVA